MNVLYHNLSGDVSEKPNFGLASLAHQRLQRYTAR